MRALLIKDDGQTGHPVRAGSLTVNLQDRTVEVAGTRIHLTRKEYQVLELLSLRKSNTVSKETLLKHLYGEGDRPDGKIIDVFICNLRRKLASASNGEYFIETVRGRGYHLCIPREDDEKISA